MQKLTPTLGLGLLVMFLTWAFHALILVHQDPGVSFLDQIFSPTLNSALLRLGVGICLALATIITRLTYSRKSNFQGHLVQQKDLYKTLVESGPECILVHQKGRISFANNNALKLFGLADLGQHEGESILDFILPEYLDLVNQNIEELREGKNPSPIEIQVRTPAGKILDVRVYNARMSWEGHPAFLTFLRDITEENRTRQVLMDSRERLQLALDAARDGAWDWDISTGQVVYSESWASMLGHSLEEVSGTLETWRKLIHPDDYLRAQTLLDNHLEGFIPGYEIEVRLRHKKGHYIWVLDRGRVVSRDGQGIPLRMAGTIRDITARKEAELAIEIRNRVAEAFLTTHPDQLFGEIVRVICGSMVAPAGLFVTTDIQDKLMVMGTFPEIATMPARLEAIFSVPEEELPEAFDRVINQDRFYLNNEPQDIPHPPFKINCVLGLPISNRRKVLGAIFMANKAGGFQQSDRLFMESLAGYIAPILQSHLNSVAKETQLLQAQKMEALGSLAGGIAHDFNNILQAIMGFTTLALEDVGDTGNLPNDLQRVLKATRRGQDLVQRILLFSRRDEHKHQSIELQSVVAEALNLLKPSIPATIEIRSTLKAEGVCIMADPGQISQIILNLATNAYHAMKNDGGILDISLSTNNSSQSQAEHPEHLLNTDLAVLTISDTGVGMSEQILARLYDPFFTTKEVGQGTGLGMSVVHGIVQAHGGHIQVHSEIGMGTVINVLLPVHTSADDPGVPATSRHQAASPANGQHIALIDDEKDITDLGKALLERRGYKVTCHNNGRHFLEVLEDNPGTFDLVITDLTMPEITGLQLATRMNSLCPEVPVILITGMTEEKSMNLISHSNIKGLIRKPFGGSELRNMVESVITDKLNEKST